jgi:hypothetical protein
MKNAYCHLSASPLRAEPSDRSEMVSQLLFAELVEIVEENPKWALVRSLNDNYGGWVDKKQITQISQEEVDALNPSDSAICDELLHPVVNQKTGEQFFVSLGCILPGFKNGIFSLGNHTFTYSGNWKPFNYIGSRNQLLETAKRLLSSAYLWGGRTPLGIDCSGFSQIVYRVNGIKLMRDAWQQAEHGIPVEFATEALPGDLAFFDNPEGTVTHVGILDGQGQIIHASGCVRTDAFDHQGIYNRDQKVYTHKLRVIKRMLLSED